MMNLQFIEKSKNGINKTIQFKGFEDFIFLDEEKYDIDNINLEEEIKNANLI